MEQLPSVNLFSLPKPLKDKILAELMQVGMKEITQLSKAYGSDAQSEAFINLVKVVGLDFANYLLQLKTDYEIHRAAFDKKPWSPYNQACTTSNATKTT